MSTIYDNLPSPVFLGIAFVVPIFILIYFHNRKYEYPLAFLIGIVFLCLTAFSAGLIWVFRHLDISQNNFQWISAIPIPFCLITFLFIFIGAYQKAKDDEMKKRKILILSLIQTGIILFICYMAIFKPWR